MGFNAGHSSLNWLLNSRPSSRVLAFDLGRHEYVKDALTFLQVRARSLPTIAKQKRKPAELFFFIFFFVRLASRRYRMEARGCAIARFVVRFTKTKISEFDV